MAEKRDGDLTGEICVAGDFGGVLQFEHKQAPDNMAIIEVKLQPRHCNRFGTVHGGVIMSLLDAAGLWAGAPKDGSLPQAVTASLSCNFLRAAQLSGTQSLRATGKVIKRGRSMYFSSIEVVAEPAGRLVASAQGVYGVTQPAGKQ